MMTYCVVVRRPVFDQSCLTQADSYFSGLQMDDCRFNGWSSRMSFGAYRIASDGHCDDDDNNDNDGHGDHVFGVNVRLTMVMMMLVVVVLMTMMG